MADEIKADYEELEQVAKKFADQSQEIEQMIGQVRGGMDKLEDDWIGRGSDAFFREMKSEVLPAARRLQNALEEASRVTKEISQIMQQAEDDASSPFRSGGI